MTNLTKQEKRKIMIKIIEMYFAQTISSQAANKLFELFDLYEDEYDIVI